MQSTASVALCRHEGIIVQPSPHPYAFWFKACPISAISLVVAEMDGDGHNDTECTEMDTIILSSTETGVEVGPTEYWDWLTYQEVVDQCLGEHETAREVCSNATFRLKRRPDVSIFVTEDSAYVREYNVIVHVELLGAPWRGPSTHRTVNQSHHTCEIVEALHTVIISRFFCDI